MNRLLITELGDTMRSEMKRDMTKTVKSNRTMLKTQFPEIKNNFGSSALFMEIDKTQNPLYQKSLSDQALLNLSKVANLSLFGPKNRQNLENHLREDLLIKKQKDYLNLRLDKHVERILDDKNLMSKRKRQLLNELKKLEAKEKLKQFHHIPTEQSQFSSLVEDTDRENKLMSIVNAEGKLLQLKRRYEKKQQEEQKMKEQVKMNYCKFKDNQIMHIEALKIMEHEEMENDVKDIFMNKDMSEIRFMERLNEKHVKEQVQIWKQHHFPRQHRKWLSK
ncbi:unnamed protein product (macronuclear) [Paramecium tetraurelia]|uniref:Uncharacterized protein n=1 Tax=Paramecium tetraurelia TaxID=5888 RepID=A0CMK2_PARTE|nr:uncharacterized protein GSPATT00008498001 [Paramecium tetraurelia]CAK72019.1 unnamed protein product [Paramecium tetraurelia]|eukprot:XP_001439416.1 hypothetical protein (macronuclear) [Paramecium tetraurelia strain d4-2]